MYAPLPPQYKTPAHLLHALLCLPTLGAWGIVWGVSAVLANRHNRSEDERYRRERAQGMAVHDAQRVAHDQWLHGQLAWLGGEIRRHAQIPAVRPPFVVDAPNPGPFRPGRQAPQRRPITAGPRPAPSPVPRQPAVEEVTGRHSEEVVETRAMPAVKPKEK